MTIETIDYHGWNNSLRLSNGIVEMIIVTDIGPRILHWGFIGQENELFIFDDDLGKKDDQFHFYGGHRLWHAPEHPKRTYHPDQTSCNVEYISEDEVIITAPVESTTGIQKALRILLDPQDAAVTVDHHLINHNLWEVEFAPWALTMMASGGTGIFPMPPKSSHESNLLPVTSFALWAYTDIADPRWTWGSDFVLLRQTADGSNQKIGMHNQSGWIAYANHKHLMIKTFSPQEDAVYPDFNSTIETFTDSQFLELETLGPLQKVQPDQTIKHQETWHLFDEVETPTTDADVHRDIMPKVLTLGL